MRFWHRDVHHGALLWLPAAAVWLQGGAARHWRTRLQRSHLRRFDETSAACQGGMLLVFLSSSLLLLVFLSLFVVGVLVLVVGDVLVVVVGDVLSSLLVMFCCRCW